MAEKHTKLLIRDACLSTIFVYACIAIFALNPFNFHLFNIIGESFKDFEVTDIIYSGKHSKHLDIETKISNEIVLINAADRDRAGIAHLISKINIEKPAVIGIDFLFEGPKDPFSDSLLKSALDQTDKLVLASKFKNSDPETSNSKYYPTWEGLGKRDEGYANLMIPGMDKTVRYFRSKDYDQQKTVNPFALELVKQVDKGKYAQFKQRNNDFELINYEGNLNSLQHFNGNDIESGNYPKGFLKGKIVLLGFFGSDYNPNPILDDYFFTPLNEKLIGQKVPDAYGIVIQANIINMILKGNYIYKMPSSIEWIIGFLICFLLNFIFLRLFVHVHLWYHFYAKLIQLGLSIVLLFLFIYLFKTFHIKLSAAPFLVPILLNVDLLYFYDTLVKWLNKKFKIKTYFLTGPMHH
jgi:CHASE2 domain-containing sensor protein